MGHTYVKKMKKSSYPFGRIIKAKYISDLVKSQEEKNFEVNEYMQHIKSRNVQKNLNGTI